MKFERDGSGEKIKGDGGGRSSCNYTRTRGEGTHGDGMGWGILATGTCFSILTLVGPVMQQRASLPCHPRETTHGYCRGWFKSGTSGSLDC